MTTQELEYLVKVNDRDLAELRGRVKDVNKALGSETGNAARNAEGHFGRVGKAAGLAALGLAGAGAASLAGAAKIGWDEYKQGAEVAAQTNAVLKSTGAVAGVSAAQVSNLAGALLKKSGVDDEAIQSGENLLLTFTDIRNEAGKGNDIFTQATKTMLDMSVALGQDTKSSAIQLGKALNDPIKGVTALQRVGVSFTAAQKDQIKALVASGHTLEAQKLILHELNKEFGGSAEAAGKTLPGQLNVLKETFNNVAGSVVGAVVPALTAMLKGITDNLPAISQFVGGLANDVQPVVSAVFGFIKTDVFPILNSLRDIFVGAVRKIAGTLEAHKTQLTEIWRNVRTLLDSVASVLKATVIPIVKLALEKVLPTAIAIALPVIAKLSAAFRIIGDVVNAGADAINAVRSALGSVASFAQGAWPKVKSALEAPIKAAKAVFEAFAGVLHEIKSALDDITSAADHAFSAVGKVTSVAGKVGGFLGHLVPGHATGVVNAPGGVALVGEDGPELVRLPRGADVIRNERTRIELGRTGRGGGLLDAAAGLFAGATFIVRDELDAAAIGASVSSRLAVMLP